MSRLVSRILLAILMFPLAGIVYLLVTVTGMSMRRRIHDDLTVFIVADCITWLFVATYWCLLWRTGVQWNSTRIAQTWLAVLGALAVGSFIGVLATAVIGIHGNGSIGLFIGGISAIVLWVAATVFVWRETPAERAQRISRSSKSAVTCPTCGYNLTGLSESRCPECGSKFTLDELIAGQPSSRVDIE